MEASAASFSFPCIKCQMLTNRKLYIFDVFSRFILRKSFLEINVFRATKKRSAFNSSIFKIDKQHVDAHIQPTFTGLRIH